MTNMNLFYSITLTYMGLILIFSVTNFIHPAITIMLLLTYTISLCLNLGSWKPSYILPILLFLIMISGLLIIFLYFSSLVSNEKSRTPNMWISGLFMMLILMVPHSLTSLAHIMQINAYKHPMTEFMHLSTNLQQNTDPSMSLMFQAPSLFLTTISMVYLLITLISIIKITTPKIKSMRKMM